MNNVRACLLRADQYAAEAEREATSTSHRDFLLFMERQYRQLAEQYNWLNTTTARSDYRESPPSRSA